MAKFDLRKALEREMEIKARLNEMATNLENEAREMNEAEKEEKKQLMREFDVLDMKVAAAKEVQPMKETADKNAMLREAIKGAKNGKSREISLSVLTSGDTNNITSAGAINLTINDILPNLEKGLIWGQVGMKVQTGVNGNILWPYSTSNVEIEEVGETVALTDKDIDFANISAVPYRSGITIKVSNEAIDDASFDLLGYVQEQFNLAVQRYLNYKTFSHASFSGMHGPYSGNVESTAMSLSYSNLKAAKAAIAATGVNMNGFAYIVSAAGKALLETTSKDAGSGRFICENGNIDGDPVFVTEYINTDANGAQTATEHIGLGVWSYLAANQHGNVRLVVDPYTLAASNQVKITLNTRWSETILRSEAFACYELA